MATDSAAGAVTVADVQATARLADLPLSDERAAAVAGLLSAWVPPANALSARMRAVDLDRLMPAVVFAQTDVPNEEAPS